MCFCLKISAFISHTNFFYGISVKRTVQYKLFLPSPIFSLQKTFLKQQQGEFACETDQTISVSILLFCIEPHFLLKRPIYMNCIAISIAASRFCRRYWGISSGCQKGKNYLRVWSHHRRSSFTEGCLPLDVVFHLRSSCTKDCLPLKVVFK